MDTENGRKLTAQDLNGAYKFFIMKSIRKYLKSISSLFAFLILFVSCEQYDSSIDDNLAINRSSGEELFKGVFFGFGDFAKNINIFKNQKNNINDLSDIQKLEIETDIEKLISEINKNNPAFFNSFKNNIISNNHRKIEVSLAEGSFEIMENIKVIIPEFDEIFSVVEDKIKNQKDDLKTEKDINNFIEKIQKTEYDNLLDENIISNEKSLCSWAIACVLYFVLAVHNQVAVASNIAVAITIYLWVALWGPALDSYERVSSAKSTLKKEMLIEEIANVKW